MIELLLRLVAGAVALMSFGSTFAAPPSIPTEAVGGARIRHSQPWAQKGLILAPGFGGSRSKYRISAPDVVKLPDGRLRLYFWGVEVKHYIYAAEASASDPLHWALVNE